MSVIVCGVSVLAKRIIAWDRHFFNLKHSSVMTEKKKTQTEDFIKEDNMSKK